MNELQSSLVHFITSDVLKNNNAWTTVEIRDGNTHDLQCVFTFSNGYEISTKPAYQVKGNILANLERSTTDGYHFRFRIKQDRSYPSFCFVRSGRSGSVFGIRLESSETNWPKRSLRT